jgi:hypothetical protein
MRKAIFIFIAIILVAVSVDWIDAQNVSNLTVI